VHKNDSPVADVDFEKNKEEERRQGNGHKH
jgi:hypothetical protein